MKTVCLVAACLALAAGPSAAQSLELGISGGYGTLNGSDLSSGEFVAEGGVGTQDYSLSNGVRIGGRMAFNPRAYIGHEVSYAYQHLSLTEVLDLGPSSQTSDLGTVRAHNFFYNMVLHALPEGSPFRPFVTGGGGFTSFFLPGFSSFSGYGNTKFGYNYGGGLKFNFFMYGLRFDVRNHVTGRPFGDYLPNVSGTLNNMEYSVTFSFLIG